MGFQLRVVALLLLSFTLTACAGDRSPADRGGPNETPAPLTAGLLAGPRAVAAHTPPQIPLSDAGSRLLLGAYALQQSACRNVSASGHSAVFSPQWSAAGTRAPDNLALAVYGLDLTGYAGSGVLSLGWQTPPGRPCYYVGIGTWQHDRWEWHRGTEFTDGKLDLGELTAYISSANLLLVAVVVISDQQAVLDTVEIGARWVVEGVDLSLLFAPPVDAETQAVEGDWAGRTPVARDFVIVDETTAPSGDRTLVVSHTVDDLTHYGAIRIPAHGPGAKLPLLLLCHAGVSGTNTGEFARIDDLVGYGAVSDSYIMVLPSFRGETLQVGGDSYTSEGPQGIYDRDCDDALALLDCAIKYLPEADADTVVVEGISRGTQVAQRAAQRDDRIDGAVLFYGMVDYWLPAEQDYLASGLAEAAAGEPTESYIQGLYDGEFTVWDVRLGMLRWSTAYYAERFPALQAHYGTSDQAVPIEQGDRLNAVLLALAHPDFEYFRYPGGAHNPSTLPGCGERMRDFLLAYLVDD